MGYSSRRRPGEGFSVLGTTGLPSLGLGNSAQTVRKPAFEALNALPQLIWVTDQSGSTLFHNQAWTSFTGTSEADTS